MIDLFPQAGDFGQIFENRRDARALGPGIFSFCEKMFAERFSDFLDRIPY